jgi:hypothetical protein
MDKDIGKIPKNDTTEIVIRVDDFGGRRGLTVREFVTSERYTGFTKAGTRIPAEHFVKFKEMINSISEEEMAQAPEEPKEEPAKDQKTLNKEKVEVEKPGKELPDY